MMKMTTLNNKIKEYVLNESDMPILLIAKLAHYFGSLPDSLPMIRNPKASGSFFETRTDEQQYLSNLNLHQQISQQFPEPMLKAHREFIMYCVFLNLCADAVSAERELIEQL